MEIYERYKTYFIGASDYLASVSPLDDDAICSACLEEQIINHFTVPCCGKKFHTECLGKWFTKNDRCPTCGFKLITNTNRKNSSQITYEPVKRDMDDYLYILWLLGANRVLTLDINKLLRGVLNDHMTLYKADKEIFGISYMINLYNYMFFGQHLLTDKKRVDFSNTTSKIMNIMNLIPIFYLMIIQVDDGFSRFLINIITIIYGLYYNMGFMSSYDIRNIMYRNFSNSSIGWIYYFIMFTFKFTIVTPLCLLSSNLLLNDILSKLILFNIFLFFFEASIVLSTLWFSIRDRINTKIFKDEMFKPTNMITFINRHKILDQTISVADVLHIVNAHSDTIINVVKSISSLRSMYPTPNPNSLLKTVFDNKNGETFDFRLPKAFLNKSSDSTFDETIASYFPVFPTLPDYVLRGEVTNREYVNFSNLQTQDCKTTPIISDFTDEDLDFDVKPDEDDKNTPVILDFVVNTEEDDSTNTIEKSKNDETVVKKRSGWF